MTGHAVSFSSIAKMELTELPTHIKGAWRVTASRWPDRKKKIDHSPRIHSLTRSPAHPTSVHSPNYTAWIYSLNHPVSIYSLNHPVSIYSLSIHLLTQDPKQRRESVTCNLLQPTSNQNGTDIMNQRLTCGPRALHLPCLVKQCLVYLVYPLRSNYCTWSTVSHPTAAHQAVSLTSASPQVSSSTYR